MAGHSFFPIWFFCLLPLAPAWGEPGVLLNEQSAPGQSAAFQEQTAAPPPAQAGDYRTETIASGLARPWSIAFLPDDRFLVTERAGHLRLVGADGHLSPPLEGVPEVRNGILGGLLDIVLDPDFAANGLLYVSYLEPRGRASGLAIVRARLQDDPVPALADPQVIFRATPDIAEDTNLGGRMIFGGDGFLYVTVGDRFQRQAAQDLSNHLGKVIRIRSDGGIPGDNPFLMMPQARPEIFAYGMRNPLGLGRDSAGRVWEVEDGPKGGDELNLLRPGANYGWPVITYGRDYDDKPIGSGTARAGMEQPVYYWDPSIAVSGMTFYDGTLFPDWNGDIFVSALKGQRLSRLGLSAGHVVQEEQLLGEIKARIRDVREGPDGALYILTDEDKGRLVRVTPNLISGADQPVRR